MNISEEIIQKVREQNDIVDVISETVVLKRAGNSFKGLCPFHKEKTGSFSVSQEKQIFTCFGCGEKGNVIHFIMKNKNVSFVEAVKILADRANIEIIEDNQKNAIQKNKYEKLYQLNVEAARYFFNNLRIHKNAAEYFARRKITESTIRRFGLGYAKDGFNNMINYLRAKGYSELDMFTVGLISKSEKGNFYDKFRNRVIFPVFDYRGKVIGFGGRVLDSSLPKYLNSPETPIFKKGSNLYGLNFAIKNSNGSRVMVIVEGYMDCISLHQCGITNVVASLGTALTTHQAKLLKRYADRIVISYDADAAGVKATLRGLDILKDEGFDVRVLTVPEGKDPDEYIKNHGREAFLKLIDDALPLIEYKIKSEGEGIDFKDKEAVIKYAEKTAQILVNLNPVEKDVYIKKISEKTAIKEQAIYDLLNKEIEKSSKIAKNYIEVNTLNDFGQKLLVEEPHIKAERTLLRLIVVNNESSMYIYDNIGEQEFVDENHKKIYNLILESKDLSEKELINHISLKCDSINCSKEWLNILETDIKYENNNYEKLINDCIKEIKKFKLEESKKELMNKIKEYELNGLMQQSLALAKELVEIQKRIAGLQL